MSRFLLPVMCLVFIIGCSSRNVLSPSSGDIRSQKTQLQIREFQTRSYETSDLNMVMKAVLNVLQDDGYMVRNAVPDLGLLTAEKHVDIENKASSFWKKLWRGKNARWKKTSIIECTANVSDFGEQTRVRVNFQVRVLDNFGNAVKIQQVDEQEFYQTFFFKVDKGIFIQKEQI